MKRVLLGVLLGAAFLTLVAVAAGAAELTLDGVLPAHGSGAPAAGIVAMVNDPATTVALTPADLLTSRNQGVPESEVGPTSTAPRGGPAGPVGSSSRRPRAKRARRVTRTVSIREGDAMKRQEARGKFKQIQGRAKQVVGIVTNDRELEREGAMKRAEGALQEDVGEVRRKVGAVVARLARPFKK